LPDSGSSFVPIRLVMAESPSSPVEAAPGSPAGEAGGSLVEIALPNGCRFGEHRRRLAPADDSAEDGGPG
jgi:hypothetical protein